MTRPPFVGLIVLATLVSDAPGAAVHVPCAASGAACGEALQKAVDDAAPGTTITLDPGKAYEAQIVIKPKAGASAARRLTITTRGWSDKGAGWDGLVTPADKPRLAVLRAPSRHNAVVEVENGPSGGNINLFGLAFEAIPPAGQGAVIRIGSGEEKRAANLARHISIRQVLIQGDRHHGQKRGIAANGQDIAIEQVWCEEVFIPGQDAQCIAAWNGGKHVRVRYAYLAAGAENLLIGGAPIDSREMEPEDWLIEDVILHKPLRWKGDRENRQVKNLLEFKYGKDITVRRVLAVNNWKAAQDGTGLLLNYTTGGRCPQCGNLENVLIEDFVMLNVGAGVSFQGYAHRRNAHSDGKLRQVTLRNAYIQLAEPGRTILIANVLERHDIRVERSTFINEGSSWLMGLYGRAWADDETQTRGGPMAGLWLLDNVFARNGKYGITAPDGHHYGSGIGKFVQEDLQIAGNVFGDAPSEHLENYDRHTGGGPANEGASSERMRAKLTATACAEWAVGKGADCTRLAPVFALLKRLPEP